MSTGIGQGIGEGLHAIAANLRQRNAQKQDQREKEAERLEKQLDQIALNRAQLKQELGMIPQGTPDYVSKAGELQNLETIMEQATQTYHSLGADDPTWLMTRLKGWFGRKQPQVTAPVPGASQTPELLSAAAPRPDFNQTDAGIRHRVGLEQELGIQGAKKMAEFTRQVTEQQNAATIEWAKKNGMTEDQVKDLTAVLAGIPASLLAKQETQNDAQPLGEPYAVNGKTFQRFRDKSGNVTEKEIPGPPKTENKGVDERAMDAWLGLPENKGKNESDYLKWKSGLGKDEEGSMTLSAEALDIAARRYLQDGTLPPMGMGQRSTTQRERILNRAAQMDPEANIAGNVASYASQKSALTQLEKTINAVESFEGTALKNLDQFIKTARKVVDSGSPWVNQVIRTVSKSGMGDADQAAYDAARQVAMTEIARVVSNPNLTGVLSDSARHEMDIVLAGNATLRQILAAAEVLKNDMKNRSGSLKAQRDTLKKDLSQTPGDLKEKTDPNSGWSVKVKGQ